MHIIIKNNINIDKIIYYINIDKIIYYINIDKIIYYN